ncbi:hypothetical protein C3B58_22855 [Lactonifactor longoviformis]|uniref:Flavodoxin n=1 Tax=Lactonifactor longoviformis DSM 17459 TaxID=1122155 RepID=A0A1M4UQH3_9CLOT|nr:hypothetical protein C3B58_22855 [Lactonifactor longoviformis]SHE58939.1 Flavodoxin [Lactonifactor longoviformis DSM 17459]
MSEILVAYFSATGITEKLAKKVAEAVGGGLHEIQPEIRKDNHSGSYIRRKRYG